MENKMNMKTERGILTVLLLIISTLFSTSAIAQGVVVGKKKKKVKTEQTQSTDTKRKPSAVSRQQHKTESQSQIINNLINNMVYVEGGSFTMGSEDSDAYSDEKPAHRETVRSFSIGKYEVTQREWKAVMGNNPSSIKGDNLPVENVSWDD